MNGGRIDNAIVVGGGIGGLCAAIALLNIGTKVKVYEKAGQLKAVGAGMSLDPNGSHALARLGLEKQVQALAGANVDGIGIRDGRDGRWLSYIPIKALQAKFGIAPMGVYRPILQEFLIEAVLERGGVIECGASCTGFEQDSQQVRVHFANGNSDTTQLLVGADGIHSKIRQQLWGGQPVRPANQIYWRSAIEFDHHRLQTPGELWGVGRGLVFGAMPVQRGMVHWYAVHNAAFGRAFLEQAGPEETKAWLQDQFSGRWVKICRELISNTPASAIIRTEIADLNPLKQWSQGRVTLLGDAAHAMNPAFGQGASQAAEDAVTLALALQKFPQLSAALQHYEQLRIRRTTKLIKQARMLSRLMQLENPGLARARNRFLRLAFTGERTSLQQLQWLYDYDFS